MISGTCSRHRCLSSALWSNNNFNACFPAVVILSVRGVLVRKFMLAAHALGMSKGEYLFLDVEIFQVIIKTAH